MPYKRSDPAWTYNRTLVFCRVHVLTRGFTSKPEVCKNQKKTRPNHRPRNLIMIYKKISNYQQTRGKSHNLVNQKNPRFTFSTRAFFHGLSRVNHGFVTGSPQSQVLTGHQVLLHKPEVYHLKTRGIVS